MAVVRNRHSGVIIFQCEGEFGGNDLSNGHFESADFGSMDLRFLSATNTNFLNANFNNASLRFMDLQNSNFVGADLRGTDLRGTDLRGADLRGTDLRGTDLRGADISNASFTGVLVNSETKPTSFRDLYLEVPVEVIAANLEVDDSLPNGDHLLNQALTFGVEIECYLPSSGDANSLKQRINSKLTALDVDLNIEFYNHHSRSYWKMITDGSLDDYERGIELVSPILRGDDGLDQLKKVCKVLQEVGCRVNKKCGVHIHIGARDESITFFRNLFMLYSGFEPIIDSMMPKSRRDNEAAYCKSNKVPLRNLQRCRTIEDIGTAITDYSNSNGNTCDGGFRYVKLNIQSYWRHGTVEFRQHAGSISYKKIMNWIKLCMALVEKAKVGIPDALDQTSQSDNFVNPCRLGTNRHKFVEMLMSDRGVTTREYNEAIYNSGREVQCASLIKQLNLKVTTRKERERGTINHYGLTVPGRLVTRYFLARGPVVDIPSNFVFNKETFINSMGFEPETVQYIEERIQHFA
ncbi:MAG: amidoligase family protein [Legionella sp.]|uniref:amidoligase family protein n=1 Tax=Legionella sp. TaxID=459 RepID=UPI00283F15FB|nr:amidoligase family protein [Legionella sp.]